MCKEISLKFNYTVFGMFLSFSAVCFAVSHTVLYQGQQFNFLGGTKIFSICSGQNLRYSCQVSTVSFLTVPGLKHIGRTLTLMKYKETTVYAL